MSEEARQYDHFLDLGCVYANLEGSLVATVLGSSVAVSLWDSEGCFGGLCAYVYPRASKAKLSSRYGNGALVQLLRYMKDLGARKQHLRAQVFGGASPLSGPKRKSRTGEKNIEVAHKFLEKFEIPVLSSDVGGHIGRKLVFNTHTNEALVARVSIRENDWY